MVVPFEAKARNVPKEDVILRPMSATHVSISNLFYSLNTLRTVEQFWTATTDNHAA